MEDNFPRKFGKYQLLAPLAQGGMGALYLAATGDRGLERLLVIKTVLPHLADKEYIARFRDEAKVVVKLIHGNLVPVFDAGQVDGELFLAMEFIEGKDLRAMWNRCAKKAVAFPVHVAVYLIKELCRGLAYAHSFGDLQLVHRDVSPPNVLVSYQGELKLTDFGLAASTLKLEKTAPGIIYGKVSYMSPEQAAGEILDGRSDVYAAAIILWELLTGRQLFPPGKAKPQELLNRAKDPTILSPSKRAPRVPESLDLICTRALSPAREERYADANDFRAALSRWLAREAPGTDSASIESFMIRLFAADIETERAKRNQLLESIRQRAYTLPPTDDLRRMVERNAHGRTTVGLAETGRAGDDRRETSDRRNETDRRQISRVANADNHTVRVGHAGGGSQLAHAVAATQPGVDHVIDGRYRIGELIGEGGMGRVYLGEHVDIGRQVAIKILHQVYGRLPDLVERFRREARAASKIGHPHIVDVTDSGTTSDGSFYFVMEYLEGDELANVIDSEGALGVDRSLRIVTQICRALHAAHAVNIVHRDLKPENVFLTIREGVADFVKVLDFGIAKNTEAEAVRAKRLTSPGMAMGTPEYMAPEQAAGKPADVRCDVYSVGAILYEMLTGCPPYSGDNFMEILTKKATVDPKPPKEIRTDLPDEVNTLVLRAMAREPADRPISMEAFEYELTKCLSGRGPAVANMLGIASTPALSDSFSRRHQPISGLTDPSQVDFTMDPTFPTTLRLTRNNRLWTVLGGIIVIVAVTIVIAIFSGNTRPAAVRVDAGTLEGIAASDAGVTDRMPVDAAAKKSVRRSRSRGRRASKKETTRSTKSSAKSNAKENKKVLIQPNRAKHLDGTDSVGKSQQPPPTKAEANALLSRARTHRRRLQWAKAKTLYQRVASGNHRKAAGLLGLAKVAFEQKRIDRALKYANSSLRKGGGTAARIFLGQLYYKKGKYRQALKNYEEVLARDPTNKAAQNGARLARHAMAR